MKRKEFILLTTKVSACAILPLNVIAKAFEIPNSPFYLAPIDTPTADEYENYVSRAIPLTKEIALGDASIRVIAIFNESMGEAQSFVSLTSGALSMFAELIEQTRNLGDVIEKDGRVNLKKLIIQKHITTELIVLYNSARRNIANYEQLVSSYSKDRAVKIDNLRIENVNYEFAKVDIELADGVFIPLVGYDLATFAAAIIIDLFQFFSNKAEKDKIEEQAKRFNREKANQKDYEGYYVKSYDSIIPYCEDYIKEYSAVIKGLKGFLDKINIVELLERNEKIDKLYERFSKDEIENMDMEARAIARRKIKNTNDLEELLKISIDSNERVLLLIEQLKSNKDENKRVAIIQALSAEVALAKVLDLSTSKELIPVIERAIKQSAANKAAESLSDVAMLKSSREFCKLQLEMAKKSKVTASKKVEVVINTGSCFYEVNGSSSRSFCGYLGVNGPTGPIGGYGFYRNDMGGFTQFSRGGSINAFELGGAANLLSPDVGSSIWQQLVVGAVAVFDIPGSHSFSYERALSTKKMLDKHLAVLSERSKQLTSIVSQSNETRVSYLKQTIKPSTAVTLAKLPDQIAKVEKQLGKVRDNDVPPIPDRDRKQDIALGLDSIRRYSEQLVKLETNPKELIKKLDDIWLVKNILVERISDTDARIINNIYDKYFDANGIVNNQYFHTGTAVGQLSELVKSPINSAEGREIRRCINRAISAIPSSNIGSSQSLLGGISMLLAGDMCLAAGRSNDAATAIRVGSEQIDFVLGFIPGISGINDVTQLAFGIFTGDDYSGQRMVLSDYFIRSVGVLLEFAPQNLIKLGEVVVNYAVVQGARIIKELNIATTIYKVFGAVKLIGLHFIETIGEYFTHAIVQILPPEEVGNAIIKIANEQTSFVAKVDRGMQGRVFEDYVLGIMNSPKNKERILRGSAKDAAFRIPDILDRSGKFLSEIKSSRFLSLTSQFQDYLKYCRSQVPPLEFRLYVFKDTVIDPELKKALIDAGAKVYDVGPGTLVERILLP